MQDEITLIHEKRKNIFLLFFCLLFIIAISYLMVNSITNKVITSIEDARTEYRPVVKNLNTSAEAAGAGVRQIAQSGKVAIEQFSEQLPQSVAESVADVKKEYASSQGAVVGEYTVLKSTMDIEYQQLKQELMQLKSDMRRDVDWAKSELAQWRVMITWISLAFGLILTLMSIQDILENLRWFISLIKELFTRNKEKNEHVAS